MKNFPVLNFSKLTLDDMKSLGVAEGLHSPYCVKATDDKNTIVGYIIVTNKPINARKHKGMSVNLLNEVDALNANRWYNLRIVRLINKHIYDGNLESMFDYLIDLLPSDCYLWANSYWDRKHNILTTLGFTELSQELRQNPNIRIFNVYHRKLE